VVLKKKAMKSSKEKGNAFLWSLLTLILKVLGIAFLVQGFIVQLATGILYYGLLHYTLGVIFGVLAWHLHKKQCISCH